MSKLEPRFRAGVLVEENIYFSHARFNGLFKLDINSMRCSFIKEFCGCEIEMKDIHVAGTRYGDWIIFLPAMGNCIHLYNYVTDEMRCVKLNRYKNKGEMVCDAYTFEKKIVRYSSFFVAE